MFLVMWLGGNALKLSDWLGGNREMVGEEATLVHFILNQCKTKRGTTNEVEILNNNLFYQLILLQLAPLHHEMMARKPRYHLQR